MERYVSKQTWGNGKQIVIEVDLLPSEWSIDGNKGPMLHSIRQYYTVCTNIDFEINILGQR